MIRMTSLSPDDQAALIAAARGGDQDVLGELLEQYRAYLTLMARMQIDSRLRTKVSASDVVQETFTDAERGFQGFRGHSETELILWLRRILANQLAKHLRFFTAQQRDIRLELRLEDALSRSSVVLGACMMDSQSSPSRRVEKREQAVIVADALASLSADYREVLIMRHLENHSFPEIARQMDRPLESVKSLWRRSIVKLREAVLSNGPQ